MDLERHATSLFAPDVDVPNPRRLSGDGYDEKNVDANVWCIGDMQL